MRCLTARLGVPPGAVAIVRGATARRKLVEIAGLGTDAVRRALLGAPGAG